MQSQSIFAQQRTGNENFTFHGDLTGYRLHDFWAWNASNLLNNTLRGALCEFIVSSALGVDLSGCYEDWLPFDIAFPYQWQCEGLTRDIIRIEVKSSAYLQAWPQRKPSAISFRIQPTKAWDPVAGFVGEMMRQSDVYVFGLYTETVRNKADPLILDGWDFYILPTQKLNEACGTQKSLSLSMLQSLVPDKTKYSGIRQAVVNCVKSDAYRV